MKQLNAVLIVMCLLTAQLTFGQCSECNPVFTGCPPSGGICSTFDTGYAQNPYTSQLNFYMPKTLTDPAILAQCDGCSQIDLNSITVTGVSGLPTGVNYIISNNGQFNVQGGDTLGCANFCGTPLLAGSYPVTVYLSADVTAVGTPIGNVSENNVPQSYQSTLVILPDTTAGVTSFTYGNNGFVACDSITVNLSALLSAPAPNPTRYFWNINGTASQLQSPGLFSFVDTSLVPDTFPITLTTVYYNYEIQDIHIISISGGFCGGLPHQQLECACISDLDSPNPFIEIPTLGFNNSNNAPTGTCHNVDFGNLNLSIPAGTSTLAMQLWDLDENDLFHLYQNEQIGTYTLNAMLGQQAWDDNNADGYVIMDTVPGTTITETLYVVVNPTPPTPYVSAATDTFCSGDTLLLAAVAVDSGFTYPSYSYQWYNDTSFLAGASDSLFNAITGGKYHVIVTDPNTGCTNKSAAQVITLAQTAPGPISIGFSHNKEFVNPFPGGGFAVDWYYNGALVTGQSGSTLPFEGPGVYNATVYNISYPLCATVASQDSVTAGISEVSAGGVMALKAFPNPNNGKFNIQFSVRIPQNIKLCLQNTLGQVLYTKNLENFAGNFSEEMSFENISKGVYLLSAETGSGKQLAKIIIQ